MELRAIALSLLLCALIFSATEGRIPACCLQLSKKIPRKILLVATGYEMQTDTGACELKAVVLHVEKKSYCFEPHLEKRVKPLFFNSLKKHKHPRKQKKPRRNH